MLLCILSFILVTITRSQELNTTADTIQHQIESAVKFMCINQFESNGQFLYELRLKVDTIDIDIRDNNAPRQGGGLYGIGMYYRLNHHKHNDITQGFSIIDCIHNSMRYLTSQSVAIEFKTDTKSILNKAEIKNRGQLMDGNTGATALALLGLIEICIVNDDICSQYVHQFSLWTKGLLTMRDHKLVSIDKRILKNGAFTKKLTPHEEKSSAYYDSESYVAFSRLLKYKTHLMHVIEPQCKLWQQILDIVNGLDEYYIEYPDNDDAHWLIQAWHNRWVVLNQDIESMDHDHDHEFMNHYMVQILMKNKLETRLDLMRTGARCYLVEAITDVTHAVQIMMAHSKYNNEASDPLFVFNRTLWNVLMKRYSYMSKIQLFEQQVDFYFEARFDGGFAAESILNKRMRIDDTQHCVCALMKLNALVFMNEKNENSYTYMDYNDPVITDASKHVFSKATNYDVMISSICLIVVILLVNIIFFYWCHYYPKAQKRRNDLFWLGQTMESATSDNGTESDA